MQKNRRRPLVRRLMIPGMIAILTLLMFIPCVAQSSDEPVLAPENPAFVDYINNPEIVYGQQSVSSFPLGLVPESIVLPDLYTTSPFDVVTLSPTYDLRPLSKLTPIRNQGSCGSCWSFATYGSLESFLMPGESLDFSENNLKNRHGFDIASCSGGNRTMSTAYLARWGGPVSEADDPYGSTSPATVTAKKHVQDVIYLPTRASALDNDAIKNAVMTYGAVYTTYYHNNAYYKSTTAGYYYNGTSSANHAVCVVGWDDNYDRSNFLTPPAGNGAFIIRNSWGTYWGKAGYFYMSYYDSRMGKTENAVFTAEPATNYDTIYQYDQLGWISNSGYSGGTAWYANVFTAKADSSLMAASTYFGAPNANYELYIYKNPTSGPTSGATLAATKVGIMGTAGYHTVRLDAPVPITAGQKFSVVMKMYTPGYSYPIPLERPYSGYASQARANPGESYMSSNGTSWSDVASSYANTNVCLKAFAGQSSNPPAPTPGALSVTPATALNASGTVGGPFSPASQTYTLTNTGGSPINWTASKIQSWVSLSTTGGTLAAGASATVTASINSSANALAVGSYADTVSFANTTNGSGNATRNISLAVNDTPPTPTAGVLSVSPVTGLSASGNVGGPFAPASQAYTLTNTGGSSITWNVGKSQSWVSLSATTGTLAAGASTTITVSINSGAGSLAAGSYSDVVSFTNATNGNGNATRNVSLTVNSSTPPPTPVPGDYQVSQVAFSWIDPSAHARLTMYNDSVSPAQAMPFTFGFYGRTYNSLSVGSNGLMGFATSGMANSANVNIPYSYAPNAAMYPYWDNLNPAYGGSVRIGTVGTAPNRKLVISWVDVPHAYSATAKFSFQAILCEGTNNIIFQYLNVAPTSGFVGGGVGATIGIENETGTKACKYSYNTFSAVKNNSAIQFTTQSSSTSNTGGNWYRGIPRR